MTDRAPNEALSNTFSWRRTVSVGVRGWGRNRPKVALSSWGLFAAEPTHIRAYDIVANPTTGFAIGANTPEAGQASSDFVSVDRN
jgi:hypothetical protein